MIVTVYGRRVSGFKHLSAMMVAMSRKSWSNNNARSLSAGRKERGVARADNRAPQRVTSRARAWSQRTRNFQLPFVQNDKSNFHVVVSAKRLFHVFAFSDNALKYEHPV